MDSPFPGTDPYLDDDWGDVHNGLITYAQAILNEMLPSDLRARTQERVLLELPSDNSEPETQGFIEILESHTERRVITVLEVVSPSNKYAGRGRDLYRKKQRDRADSSFTLVEIVLLRAGPSVLQLPLSRYPPAC